MLLFKKIKALKSFGQYVHNNEIVKLHVGCGRNYKKGWLNLDVTKKVNVDVRWDIRYGLPFPDESVNFIFNEHVIEHLSYDDGLNLLKESHRVLKKGGVLRTAFPDLDLLIDSYVNDYWRDMEWVKLINAQSYPSGCYMLNECIREKGEHKYMYSCEELSRQLEVAGFSSGNIKTVEVQQSSFSELVDVEKRADSSVVEAIK